MKTSLTLPALLALGSLATSTTTSSVTLSIIYEPHYVTHPTTTSTIPLKPHYVTHPTATSTIPLKPHYVTHPTATTTTPPTLTARAENQSRTLLGCVRGRCSYMEGKTCTLGQPCTWVGKTIWPTESSSKYTEVERRAAQETGEAVDGCENGGEPCAWGGERLSGWKTAAWTA